VTEETIDIEGPQDPTRRLVTEAVSALAAALALAAAMVVVLAWISTWQDVQEVGTAQYLFWPLATAAVTLQVLAARIGRGADRGGSPGPGATSGTSA
jgi:hypothetical protein